VSGLALEPRELHVGDCFAGDVRGGDRSRLRTMEAVDQQLE
jgi:hypothetical protein